jgi:hypothetical protein
MEEPKRVLCDVTTTEPLLLYFIVGTARQFFHAHPELCQPAVAPGLLVIGFNPGFGSGNESLLASWKGDLQFLLEVWMRAD